MQLVGWHPRNLRNLHISDLFHATVFSGSCGVSLWILFGVWLSASAVRSEEGTGDFSPETALLAALAHGQTSCSVSCIIAMFLEVSEINRASCPLLC